MSRPRNEAGLASPGLDVADLPTPCLLVDLDVVELNLRTAADFYRSSTCKIRPHMKNHASPQLARMQLEAGGTVGGVCVSKVAECEVMVGAGIRDVLITNQITAENKMERLTTLCSQASIAVACDDSSNAEHLSQAALRAGIVIGVVIEVETGTMGRGGVRSPRQGVELAAAITRLPGLHFRGVMSHQVAPYYQPPGGELARRAAGLEAIGRCIAVRDAIVSAGIPVEVVSTGETWTWDIARDVPGVTEVQLGSYLLMDAGYAYLSDFAIAASVMGRIQSVPEPDLGVGDVGLLTLGGNRGLPRAVEPEGVVVEAIDDHRVLLRSNARGLHVGDPFRLVPGNQDTMVSRWDRYVATRGSRAVAVWEIPGRGCFN